MNGSIFIEQLKRSWRQSLYWGGGLAGLAFFMCMILQDSAISEQYGELLEQFPPIIINSLGLEDAALVSTPEGFLSFAAFTYGSIILAVFGVTAGLNIIANDEEGGEMNVMLALPIPRWRVIVEKFLAYVVILAAIPVVMYGGIILGSFVTPVELDLGKLLVGTLNLIPAGLSILGITVFVTSLFSRRLISSSIAAAFVMGSYVLNVAGEAVTEGSMGDTLSAFSIWHYFDTLNAATSGINPTNVFLLLAIAVVTVAVATFFFERRDVAG